MMRHFNNSVSFLFSLPPVPLFNINTGKETKTPEECVTVLYHALNKKREARISANHYAKTLSLFSFYLPLFLSF